MAQIEETKADTSDLRSYLAEGGRSFKTLGWIWKELVSDEGRSHLKKMLVWMVGQTFLLLIPSWAIGVLLDYVSPTMPMAWKVGALIMVALSISLIAKRQLDRLRELALGEIIICTDRKMTELFMSKAIGQYLEEDATLSSANVEKARGRVWEAIYSILFMGSGAALYIGISYVLLWVIFWPAGVVASALIVVFFAWALKLNFRVSSKTIPLDAEFRRHNRLMRDVWDHVEWVLNTGRAHEEIRSLDQLMKKIIYESDRPIWLDYIDRSNWRDACGIPLIGLMLALCILHVDDVSVSSGIIVPVFVYSTALTEHLRTIGRLERHLTWSMPSLRSMVEALTTPSAIAFIDEPIVLEDEGAMAVELRKLSHTYTKKGDPRLVLSELSLCVEPGEKLGVVGPTGSGKSTLYRLLLRYFDPDAGSILYDGVDLRHLDLNALRRAIGIIPQDPPVMMGTIKRNLLFSVPEEEREGIADEEMWRVLALVQLDDRERLTDGLDTKVGRNGIQLSGGEKQRLIIAATIIQRKRLLLIDEATSSLDVATEQRLQKEVFEMLGRDTTAIIVTHRYSALAGCDRIVVLRPAKELENGDVQIEAIGTYEELLVASATFRSNAALQGMANQAVATA